MNKLDEIKKDFKKRFTLHSEVFGDILGTVKSITSPQEEVKDLLDFITEVYTTGVKEGGEKMLSEVLKVIPEEKEEEYLMIDGKVIKDGNYANSVFNQCRKQCIERINKLLK